MNGVVLDPARCAALQADEAPKHGTETPLQTYVRDVVWSLGKYEAATMKYFRVRSGWCPVRVHCPTYQWRDSVAESNRTLCAPPPVYVPPDTSSGQYAARYFAKFRAVEPAEDVILQRFGPVTRHSRDRMAVLYDMLYYLRKWVHPEVRRAIRRVYGPGPYTRHQLGLRFALTHADWCHARNIPVMCIVKSEMRLLRWMRECERPLLALMPNDVTDHLLWVNMAELLPYESPHILHGVNKPARIIMAMTGHLLTRPDQPLFDKMDRVMREYTSVCYNCFLMNNCEGEGGGHTTKAYANFWYNTGCYESVCTAPVSDGRTVFLQHCLRFVLQYWDSRKHTLDLVSWPSFVWTDLSRQNLPPLLYDLIRLLWKSMTWNGFVPVQAASGDLCYSVRDYLRTARHQVLDDCLTWMLSEEHRHDFPIDDAVALECCWGKLSVSDAMKQIQMLHKRVHTVVTFELMLHFWLTFGAAQYADKGRINPLAVRYDGFHFVEDVDEHKYIRCFMVWMARCIWENEGRPTTFMLSHVPQFNFTNYRNNSYYRAFVHQLILSEAQTTLDLLCVRVGTLLKEGLAVINGTARCMVQWPHEYCDPASA